MTKMKNKKLNEIKVLEKEISKLEKKCESLEKKRTTLIQKYTYCCCNDFEYKKFDLKTQKLKKLHKGIRNCGERQLKEDFLYVITERYCAEQTQCDNCYGDDDKFAWVHRFTKYRVCQKCGGMTEIDSKVASQSSEWTRCNWDKRETALIGVDFIPKDWDYGIDEKVIFVGTEKECDKKFKRIR